MELQPDRAASQHVGQIKLQKARHGFITSPSFATDVFYHMDACEAGLTAGDVVVFSLQAPDPAAPGRLAAACVARAPPGTDASPVTVSDTVHVGLIAQAAAMPDSLGLLRYYEQPSPTGGPAPEGPSSAPAPERAAQLTFVHAQGLGAQGQPLAAGTVVRFRTATNLRQQRVAASSAYARHAAMQAVELQPLTAAGQVGAVWPTVH